MAMIEKAMYIKGLCDGVDLDKTTKEGKLIAALLDIVTEMATELDDMQSKLDDLQDYCEELDEDLGTVEEVLLDIDDEDDFDGGWLDDAECDGDCASCGFDCGFDDDDEDEWDEDELMQITCPACGDEIHFDATIDPENLTCPGCGEKIGCIVCEDDYNALDLDENAEDDNND